MEEVDQVPYIPLELLRGVGRIDFGHTRAVTVCRAEHYEVTVQNLMTLLPQGCLAGDVLNAFGAAIQERFGNCSFGTANKRDADVHIMNTFWFQRMWTERNAEAGRFTSIKGWTKSLAVNTLAKLIVPVNLSNVHWITLVLDKSRGTVFWFDSMNGDYTDMARLLMEWWNYHGGTKHSTPSVRFRLKAGVVPTQLPGSNDCGIFTGSVMYDQAAECRHPSLPTPQETGRVRAWMLFIILRGGFGDESPHMVRARRLRNNTERADRGELVTDDSDQEEAAGQARMSGQGSPEGLPRSGSL